MYSVRGIPCEAGEYAVIDFPDDFKVNLFVFAGRIFQMPVFVEGTAYMGAAGEAAHGDEDVRTGNGGQGLGGLCLFHIYMVEGFQEPPGSGVDAAFRRGAGGAEGKGGITFPGQGFCHLAAAVVVGAEEGNHQFMIHGKTILSYGWRFRPG